ncbi:MAG: hypothetical protein SFW67_05905 [Myxococcaceae bacterium]|nr:hypothetical protein [Myxococcaceae bacterium]
MRAVLVLVLAVGAACSPLMPVRPDGGEGDGGPSERADAGTVDAGTLTGQIQVDVLLEARSRLGARSVRGFRPWRGGVAIVGTSLVWVESGVTPGIFRMPVEGCGGGAGCVETIASVTRPSAFAALSDSVLVADVTVLRRYVIGGSPTMVATAQSELVNLATDGASAFWTTESSAILKTPFGGVTSTLINSNGTPFAMTVAGTRLNWVGVDISGLQAVMQSIGLDGRGAREDRRSGSGFQTMKGDERFLFFARDAAPSTVVRQTLSNGLLEVVGTNAQGVTDFAIEATRACWTEPGTSAAANGRVRCVSHESTQAETVAESLPFPVAITAHEGALYVLAAGTVGASFADGRIVRIAWR